MVLSERPLLLLGEEALELEGVELLQVLHSAGAAVPVHLLLVPIDRPLAPAHHLQLEQPLAEQRTDRMETAKGLDSDPYRDRRGKSSSTSGPERRDLRWPARTAPKPAQRTIYGLRFP
jgi:hypothetical protein